MRADGTRRALSQRPSGGRLDARRGPALAEASARAGSTSPDPRSPSTSTTRSAASRSICACAPGRGRAPVPSCPDTSVDVLALAAPDRAERSGSTGMARRSRCAVAPASPTPGWIRASPSGSRAASISSGATARSRSTSAMRIAPDGRRAQAADDRAGRKADFERDADHHLPRGRTKRSNWGLITPFQSSS